MCERKSSLRKREKVPDGAGGSVVCREASLAVFVLRGLDVTVSEATSSLSTFVFLYVVVSESSSAVLFLLSVDGGRVAAVVVSSTVLVLDMSEDDL